MTMYQLRQYLCDIDLLKETTTVKDPSMAKQVREKIQSRVESLADDLMERIRG